MDWLIGLLVLFVIFGGPRIVLQLIANAYSADRQSSPDFSSTPSPTIQISDGFEPKLNMPFKRLQFKGALPVTRPTSLTFILSAVDITNNGAKPCLFPFDAGQEKNTLAFQHRRTLDFTVSPGDFLKDWIPIGNVFPSLLHTPFSGTRKIQAIIRIVEKGMEEIVNLGFCNDGTPGLLWSGARSFEFDFKEKGYEEEKLHRREVSILAIPLAMAVSSADGRFDDEEADVVKNWIQRHVNSASSSDREPLKTEMNKAVEKAYEDGLTTGIQTDHIIARLNEVGDKSSKFEVLELCFEVMSANDKMNPDEMAFLRAYADLLDIHKDEFERLVDLHALNITADEDAGNDDERLLGLDESMVPQEKVLVLRKEFKKWNSRMAVLTDPDQRQVAQCRLDMIGRLRQKYEVEASA